MIGPEWSTIASMPAPERSAGLPGSELEPELESGDPRSAMKVEGVKLYCLNKSTRCGLESQALFPQECEELEERAADLHIEGPCG
jgi:hypothetical protein